MFTEIWERGRSNIIQFGRDFLDLDISKHEGQARWVTEAPWADERMLCTGNRWGKSYIGEVKCLHHLLYQTRPAKYAHLIGKYEVLALSHTLDMALVVWDPALVWALESPLYRRFVVDYKRTPFPELVIGEAERGRKHWFSRLTARSTAKGATYILGKTYDFINWDECAYDPDGRQILDGVLRMRVADRDGRIDFTSTGNLRNWYYEQFRMGLEDNKHREEDPSYRPLYYAQTGQTYENPFISHDKVRREEQRMTKEMREQNILGLFPDAGSVFDVPSVEKCYRGQDYSLPVPPVADGRYIGAVDFGRKQDETVILVARIDQEPPYPIVYGRGMSRCPWHAIKEEVARVYATYNKVAFLGDVIGPGDVVINDLQTQYSVNIEGHHVGGATKSKENLILRGQNALQNRLIVWPDVPLMRPLYHQLVFYDWNDKNLATDWVMAFCLLAEQAQRATHIELAMEDIPLVFGSIHRDVGTGKIDRPESKEPKVLMEMDSSDYARE